jgi:hypothetical protein
MAWYELLLLILAALGGVAVTIRMIVSHLTRRPRIRVSFLSGKYRVVHDLDAVWITARIHVQHIAGPSTEVKSLYWDEHVGLIPEHDLHESPIPLDEGKSEELTVQFRFMRRLIRIRDDKAISGRITVYGTSGAKASVRSIAEPEH